MNNDRVKTWGGISTVAILVLLIGLVGNMDYQDEVKSASVYCKNVHDGVWPDYNGTYDKECRDDKHYLEAE